MLRGPTLPIAVSDSSFHGRVSRVTAFLRKWSRWIAITAAVVAAYPVITTLALTSGLVERLISGDDVRVELENPAWTIWPGSLHVKRIGVYVNGDTQVTLSVADARVDVELMELLQRRFHVNRLSANDIRFRLRTRVPESQKTAPYVAAFPPMPELPGDTGIVREPDEKEKEKEKNDDDKKKKWTVRIDGIDARASELWFLQYRYVGQGRVRGGFMKSPERLYVDDSVQELSPGRLSFGEKHVISKNFRGRVRGHIPEIDPSDRGVLGIFEVVDADIQLDGDLVSLEHLGDYVEGLRVTGGAGPLKIRLGMQRGKLSRKTEVAFVTDDIGVFGDGYAIKSDWELAAFVGGAPDAAGDQDELPRLRSRAELSTLSWARGKSSPFTLQLHGHEQSAALSSTQIDRQTAVGDYRLRFPNITSSDVDDLDNLLGDERRVESKRGSLRGSLTLTESERGSLQGPARLRFDGVSVRFGGIALAGTGHLAGYLDVDLDARAAALGKLSGELRPVSLHAGDVRVNDWWMRLESPLVSAVGWPPERVTTDLSIVAKNAEPILQALAKKDEVPDVVADLVSLDNLNVDAKFRKHPGVIDIVLDEVQSDVLDLTGRVYVGEKQSRVALVVGGKHVSLGISKNGGDTELEAQAGAEWLRNKLRSFPPLSDGARSRTR